MKFLMRTIILLVAPFQYSGATEMGAPVRLIDGLLTVELAIQVIIAVGILYLAFIKSYFKEKGKNVATKEDIKSITQEVETVKNSYLLSTQAKLSLHNEERESLINSWNKINHWYSMVESMPLKLEIVDVEYFDKADLKLENARIQCSAAWARAELFNSNQELARSYHELYRSVLGASHMVSRALLENKYLQERSQGWSTSYGEKQMAAFRSLVEFIKQESKKILKLMAEFRDLIQKNLKELANNSIES